MYISEYLIFKYEQYAGRKLNKRYEKQLKMNDETNFLAHSFCSYSFQF